jgi:hypothetical protein
MVPFHSIFITSKATLNSYVILVDKSKVACLGSGTVQFSLQEESIILHDVLHVPKLRSPLLSNQCFWHLNGCSFIADNKGSFLTLPHFVLAVNDSSNCTISGCSGVHRTVDFDSCLVGTAVAVSDNTHFRQTRWPPTVSLPVSRTKVATTISLAPAHGIVPSTTDLPPTPSLDLHPSIEDDNHPHLPSPQAPFDPMKSVMEELNIPSGASTPTDSSPTQIQETATAIVNHLKKHGKVIK